MIVCIPTLNYTVVTPGRSLATTWQTRCLLFEQIEKRAINYYAYNITTSALPKFSPVLLQRVLRTHIAWILTRDRAQDLYERLVSTRK
ncbi:hypothetical protein DPMN_106692 [Dreissena polymorpha]|uniref:Uncharacterized protein n=1 Tax=Dreissena polymorpha TaxID=45954 RepID=A0A9D4QK18_DREPO|nr:hypothetical protein DPMN_106692 [Dreissena polymorpha]